MDDFADIGVGSLFRVIKSIVKDIVFDVACYSVGWLVLKGVTFGKYPDSGLVQGIKEEQGEDTIVSIVGLVLVVAVSYYLFG